MSFDRGLLIITVLLTAYAVFSSNHYSRIQVRPIIDQLEKQDRQSMAYCLKEIDGYIELSNGATSTCKKILQEHSYIFVTEGDIFSKIFGPASSSAIVATTSDQDGKKIRVIKFN